MKNFKQISKLFIVGIKDFKFDREVESFLKEYPIAGVALFNSPHDNPSNIWTNREASLEATYEFARQMRSRDLFIACDQEGGRVRRLRGPFVHLPSAQKIEEASDNEKRMPLIRELYSLAARQMALTAINLNFAPVCDLRYEDSSNVIGDRSYGRHIEKVLPFIQAFCQAFEDEGVHTTLKHFPGHGPTHFDSHDQIATVFKSKKELLAEDFSVFKQAQDFASAIMTAHIAFEEEPERIVSLDSSLQAELRKGFNKKLAWITDDLQMMKAVADKQPWLKAFECGYDFLSLCGTLDQAAKSIEETIRFAESVTKDYQAQSQLEKRISRSETLFTPEGDLLKFEMWKSKIVEYEGKAQEILNELSLA